MVSSEYYVSCVCKICLYDDRKMKIHEIVMMIALHRVSFIRMKNE